MSGELPFIDLNGVEISNGYRTLEYLRRGLGAMNWQVPEVYPCAVLNREIGGVGPFISPSVDPAPWYDASIPESAEFLGLVSKIDFKTIKVLRSVSQRFGGVGGGVIGVEQIAARGALVDGMLIASTCPGLEYGRAWINSRLGADCEGCALGTLRLRDSCPPADGSNDTRGEWLIYDAALVDGIERTDNPGASCCDYDGIKFTLAGQSPYLFKRQGVTSSPVTLGATGYLMPVAPAVIDTFVRANAGPPPSASWTGSTFTGYGNTLRVLSNVLDNSVHTGGSVGAAYWNAATFGPDVAVTIVVPTKVNLGQFELNSRVVSPGTANASGLAMHVFFGGGVGGLDFVSIGRRTSATGLTWLVYSGSSTFASGDTFALVARGNLVEAWRKPSGGDWIRLCAGYDPSVPVAGNVGVSIHEQGATQTLGAFGAGTLTNGAAYPVDVNTIPIAATPIGIVAPIITVTTAEQIQPVPIGKLAAQGVRMQIKNLASCSETDDFSVNNLATRWYQPTAAYTITGGKLKPTGTSGGLSRALYRSKDGTVGNRVFYAGGRVEATIKPGATIASGTWGVSFESSIFAGIRQASGLFVLTVNGAGGTIQDSVALAPSAGVTYRVILEVLPTSTAGSFDARAYVVNQASPNSLLTRPLRSTIVIGGAASGPIFTPAIESIIVDATDEWDSFYAIDYSDSAAYIEADIPAGTLIVDTPRRVSQFTPQFGAASSIEASQYLTTPIDTPLGWPDVCAGDGPACLQIFGREVAWPGTAFTVATQLKVR